MANLFNSELKVINVGNKSFGDSLVFQNVAAVNVDWRPPCRGDAKLLRAVKTIRQKNNIDTANKAASEKIKKSFPVLSGAARASEVIPGIHPKMIIHPGPPVEWNKMPPAMQRGVITAVMYENLAESEQAAIELLSSGEIEFAPSADYNCAIPYAGVISYDMPVWIVENKTYGNKAYAPVFGNVEDSEKDFLYGAYTPDIVEIMRHAADIILPVLRDALKSAGIPLKNVLADSIAMGDELQINTHAAAALFFRKFALYMAKTCVNPAALSEVISYIQADNSFLLPIICACAKSALDSAAGVPGSSIVFAQSSNGVEFGVKISGLPGQWFTAPAPLAQNASYREGFSKTDAMPQIGDNALIEAMSWGAAAIASSDCAARGTGIGAQDAVNISLQMYDICETEDPDFIIPASDFSPLPCGIDAVKMVELGIPLHLCTEIIHKNGGRKIGAGLLCSPTEAFEKAVIKLSEVGVSAAAGLGPQIAASPSNGVRPRADKVDCLAVEDIEELQVV